MTDPYELLEKYYVEMSEKDKEVLYSIYEDDFFTLD